MATNPSDTPDVVAGQQAPDPQAVADLLGVLAYGELSAFDRMASEARLAPDLRARAGLDEIAAAEFGHYKELADRLASLGFDPFDAMQPFVAPVEEFQIRTESRTWGQVLIKAYVGDGLAADFYLELAAFVDPGTRELITHAVSDEGRRNFVVSEIHALVESDPTASSTLSLWGRRLVGEAITQTQRVAAERDSLAALILGGVGGDLSGIAALTSRVTSRHTSRMSSLGLSN